MNQNSIIGDSVLGSKWFNPDYLFSKAFDFIQQIFTYITGSHASIAAVFNTLLIFFSLFFLAIIAYACIRLLEIRKKEHAHLHHEIEEYKHHQAEREKKAQQNESISHNPRWVKTLGYLFSEHASDWKLAVIEADSMLESLMNELGFKGDTLGDKLKSATQDKFKSLTKAWEVHNIRNRIAHEGMNYDLSQHEAKRVIAIYEHIFREFGYI